MGVNNDLSGLQVFGKGQDEVSLMAGYIDAEGAIHRDVIVKETTGVEEDIMDDERLSATERFAHVLAGCIVRIGQITDKALIKKIVQDRFEPGKGAGLTQVDRDILGIAIRRVTCGDVYHIPEDQRKCPICKKTNKPMSINLAELTVTSGANPDKRRCRVQIPGGGETILCVRTQRHEEKAIEIAKLMKAQGLRNYRSASILVSLESLNGEEIKVGNPAEIMAALKTVAALSKKVRSFLRSVLVSIMGGIDTELEFTCENDKCRFEWKGAIDVGQLFLSDPMETVAEAALDWV